jgi:hypothetical protein
MTNEQEMFSRLRQPFEDAALKWKIQTNPQEGKEPFALCVAYIDARDVAARLNEVVGINWESSFGDLIPFSGGKKEEWGVQCRLTVMGHTRTDIGTLSATEPLKGGYSDALKRAAVQFGIAAYVYAFPVVKAEVQKYGRSYYFTANAKKELAQLVHAIHSGAPRLPKFHAIQVRDYAPIRFDSPYFGGEERELIEEERPSEIELGCENENGCRNPIRDYTNEVGKTLSAAKLAEGTRAKYGLALCWDCAQVAKRAAEASQSAPERENEQEPTNTKPVTKEAAKNALEDARKRYEALSHHAKVLGFDRAYSLEYRQWDTAKLGIASAELLAMIRDSITSAAIENERFLIEEGSLPTEDDTLKAWMDFAADWGLIETIKADNLANGEVETEWLEEDLEAESVT